MTHKFKVSTSITISILGFLALNPPYDMCIRTIRSPGFHAGSIMDPAWIHDGLPSWLSWVFCTKIKHGSRTTSGLGSSLASGKPQDQNAAWVCPDRVERNQGKLKHPYKIRRKDLKKNKILSFVFTLRGI